MGIDFFHVKIQLLLQSFLHIIKYAKVLLIVFPCTFGKAIGLDAQPGKSRFHIFGANRQIPDSPGRIATLTLEKKHADEIDEVTGILNGTTNYILSKMASDGSDFADVLKEAQRLGYAERNPEADVEGYDACRKIAILSSLAYGKEVNYEEVYTEGITKITAEDIKYATSMGTAIKLLATSRKVGDQYYAMVSPVMIDAKNPLYSVNGVFNAIFIHGNVLGDAMFYGSGAGKLPTASAVVADIVDMTKHKNTNIYIDWSPEKLTLVDYKDSVNSFFVRTSSGKETIENAFGSVEYADAGIAGEIGFTTKDMTEAEFEKAAAQIEVRNRIRLG